MKKVDAIRSLGRIDDNEFPERSRMHVYYVTRDVTLLIMKIHRLLLEQLDETI